jgi:hypothetical protein
MRKQENRDGKKTGRQLKRKENEHKEEKTEVIGQIRKISRRKTNSSKSINKALFLLHHSVLCLYLLLFFQGKCWQ